MVNSTDKVYLDLVKDILENGREKGDRTGVGTIGVFGRQIRFSNIFENFPILTSKKIFTRSVIHELLWFISGDTNIKYLVDNEVGIWNAWPYQKYCEHNQLGEMTEEEFVKMIRTDSMFAEEFGELGPVYGKQWRDFNGIDQFKNAVETLKTNPFSRRIMVSAWNPGQVDDCALPPCHYGFQFQVEKSTKEEIERYGSCDLKLNLSWNQRSVDVPLGLPFNITSYAILLSTVAKEVGMIPGDLIGNLGDTHIYKNQLEGIQKHLKITKSHKAPHLWLNPEIKSIFDYTFKDIEIRNYVSEPHIKMPIAV